MRQWMTTSLARQKSMPGHVWPWTASRKGSRPRRLGLGLEAASARVILCTISPAPPAEQDDQAQGQEPDPAEHDAEDEEAENGSGNDWRWNQSWWQSGDWYHRDWWQESWHRSTYDTSDSWTSEVAELLPTFVQGCCKMQDLRYMNGT